MNMRWAVRRNGKSHATYLRNPGWHRTAQTPELHKAHFYKNRGSAESRAKELNDVYGTDYDVVGVKLEIVTTDGFR